MKDFITEPATKFNFNPSEFVPFKDREVCERVRKMSGKELEKREDWWHPEFNVKVMMNPHPVLIATLFSRLKAASEAGKTFTISSAIPSPKPTSRWRSSSTTSRSTAPRFISLPRTNGRTIRATSPPSPTKPALFTP